MYLRNNRGTHTLMVEVWQ